MKKIVIAPDSFKGTISSVKICHIIEQKVKEHFPKCEVVSIPIADGGEGTVECFMKALNGSIKYITCKNPYFEDMEAFYGVADKTAIIEMSACCGLPLVENRKNPMLTTTYGVGQILLTAVRKGCKRVILGLGGSCTNDCGCGAAAAVGIKFYDKYGNAFIPTGGTLKNINKIDMSEKNKLLDGVEIIAMCDIDNPMYGENGAAYIFAPQKGADSDMVKELDNGLKHISCLIERDLGTVVKSLKGGGAAGAMGAGMSAFFGAKLKMGIDTVLDAVRFNEIISDANLIFTGEGKIDLQSLNGKVVIGVAKYAKLQNVPVIVIAGGAEQNIDDVYKMGVSAVFTINRLPEDFSVSRYKSELNLEIATDNILRLLKI